MLLNMEVYIELVFLDNFLINLALENLVVKSLKEKPNYYLLCFSSLIGSIFSVIIPLYQFLNAFYIKIILAFVMVLVMKKHKSIKRYFLSLLLFLVYTFVIGGCAIGLLNIFNVDYRNNSYFYEILAVSFCGIGVAYYFIKQFTVFIAKFHNNMNKQAHVRIQIQNKSYDMEAFYDSGNTLTDDHGKPIVMIDNLFGRKILNECQPMKKKVPIKTVSGNDILVGFTVDKITIDNSCFDNITVAIAQTHFKHYQLLLSSEMIGG